MSRRVPFRPVRWLQGAAALALLAGPAAAQDAGPDVLSETYRDWVVICRATPAQQGQPATRLCEMTQELRQTEGGQRVLALALRPVGDAGAAELTMVTPFGLRVSAAVEIRLGEGTLASLPFDTCLAVGCIVRGELDAAALASLGQAETARVALPTTGGGALQIPVPLAGFDSAWTRLRGL